MWQIMGERKCVWLIKNLSTSNLSFFLSISIPVHEIISILFSESLIYVFEQFLSWEPSSLATGNGCLWNKGFIVQTKGIWEALSILHIFQGHGAQCFQARFWHPFLMNGFHYSKVQIQTLNAADLIKAAEFDPFLAHTVSAVNFNDAFYDVWEIILFFFAAWFISNNSEGLWIWHFLEWSVCLERGGLSSCFLSFCF